MRSSTLRTVALAAAFTTFGPLAVFLLGALAVLVRAELGFSEARLGITVATFFAAATISAAGVGRLTERVGGRRSLRIGLAVAVIALACVALVRSWWQLTLALAIAGIGHAVLQVGANLLLADQVPTRSQGLAFGIKQSAIPIATLTAGASVPLLGTQLGWRWAYAAAAIAATIALLSHPRARPSTTAATGRRGRADTGTAFGRRQLATLAVAAAFGAGAANALAAFLVEFAVSAGVALGVAGGLLSTVSAIGLVTRIAIGRWADVRGPVGLPAVAILLVIGGAGFASLPVATSTHAVLWIAAVLAFAAGWGWPGLFTFIVARENAAAPATATGLTQAGIFAGAVAGPLLFGITVSSLSYTVAWRGAAVAQLLGACLVIVVVRARRATHAPPG